MKILIDAKANVSAREQDGNTALHLAVASGVTKVVELLLSEGAGADIAKANIRGETPEDLAINERYWEILNKLRMHKAEENTADNVKVSTYSMI